MPPVEKIRDKHPGSIQATQNGTSAIRFQEFRAANVLFARLYL